VLLVTHWPDRHKPLAQSAPVVQAVPPVPPVPLVVPGPQTPFVHAPFKHSVLELQLAPSGRFVPLTQVLFVQIPLAQSVAVVQAPPPGAATPLPWQAPFVHTPLVQSASVVHIVPPLPVVQTPLRQRPLIHSELAAQLLPSCLVPVVELLAMQTLFEQRPLRQSAFVPQWPPIVTPPPPPKPPALTMPFGLSPAELQA
jgi:hypothetical protein